MACNTSEGPREPASPPPFRVKKEKNSEGRKAGRASKTKPPLPLAQGLKLPLNTLTNTIFLCKQFKFNDRAINEIELVVTKCSVCKCLAYHYGNNNYVHVQPLEDMKNYSVFHVGDGGKDVLS